MSADLLAMLQAIEEDLEQIPEPYLASLEREAMMLVPGEPDDRTVWFMADEGRRRLSVGDLGKIRAMARIVARVKTFADLAFEDEGPPLMMPTSMLQEIITRVRRDTHQEILTALLDQIKPDQPTLARSAIQEIIAELMEGKVELKLHRAEMPADIPAETFASVTDAVMKALQQAGLKPELLADDDGIADFYIRPLGVVGAMSSSSPRSCAVCGCTDDRACEGGCHWVGPNLCSACQTRIEAEGRKTP